MPGQNPGIVVIYPKQKLVKVVNLRKNNLYSNSAFDLAAILCYTGHLPTNVISSSR